MGTPSLRIRLLFEDRSILSKTQRSNEMNHTWVLLKLQQHRTIADVCTHLLHIFNLRRSCPNGILLSMEGFALPPFESTEILKDKEIICVKRKAGSTPVGCHLVDDVLESGDDDPLHLGNGNLDKETKEYGSESDEEVDEDQSQDEELLEETVSNKRKASGNLQNLKRKKQCLPALDDDDDEAETEETENINNDASHPMKIHSTKETRKLAATSNKKVKSPSTVKRSEELQGNVEEVNQVTNAIRAKKAPSRTARRRKAKKKREAKLAKKKPRAFSKPEKSKPKSKIKEANDQPKGLLYWKQDSKRPLQNGDTGTDEGPVVTRPRHIRFESLDEDQAEEQTGVSIEKIKSNGSSSKETDQQCGREEFSTFKRNDQSKESFKTLFKDSKVPVINPNDFDKLPPCSEPKEGDVIAYRLLELNSSWIAELSSFRVGRILFYDARDITLIPLPEYPIILDKINEAGPNDSLYGEDGTLEINYSALVDVRNVKQSDPNATEPLSDGVDQTPISDDKDAAENLVSNSNDNNMDVPKDSNPGEVNPWDRSISKNTETLEPNNPSTVGSGVNPSSYAGAGPSTSTGLDATNKAGSSEVKEGQKGNSIDSWSNANMPKASQENNSGWSNVLEPTANDCENGNSWGRPWSAFAVSKSSSVIQQNRENEWCAGNSRGSWKPMSRGVPRGRGRGRGGGRGRGRNSY